MRSEFSCAGFRHSSVLSLCVRHEFIFKLDPLWADEMFQSLGGEKVMHRVLIADDAPYMRKLLRELVETLGYEVVAEAATGLEAVELFALYQPDIATVDTVMPQGSGVDTVRMIRNRFPAAKIVMASSLGQERLVEDAMAAGAQGFIGKPYQFEAVESILALVVEKNEDSDDRESD